jgi:hypothetical protein
MARQLDDQKRLAWEKRLARFRGSRLTVARFCAEENVSVSGFHYWARRLPAESGGRIRPQSRIARRHAGESAGNLELPDQATSVPRGRFVPRVHFILSPTLRVSVPADCLDAIRCVVAFAREGSAESRSTFHQVCVGTRS